MIRNDHEIIQIISVDSLLMMMRGCEWIMNRTLKFYAYEIHKRFWEFCEIERSGALRVAVLER